MSRGKRNTFPYLRLLTLSYDQDLPDAVSRLGEPITILFTNAKKLRSLMLYDCQILEIDERIAPALAALTNLRSLDFRGVSIRTLSILQMIQAPLTEVRLDCRGLESPIDPAPVLAHLRDSLQTLDLFYVEFRSTNVQYQHVKTLHLQYCTCDELRPIILSFPNLRVLHMYPTDREFGSTDAELEERRIASVASQATHRSWLSLHRLSGSVFCLYMLGVQCRVDHLTVICALDNEENSQKFAVVLNDTHPTSLNIEVNLLDFDHSLVPVTLAPVAETLSQLMLRLGFHGIDYEDPSCHIVSTMLKLVDSSSLTAYPPVLAP